MRISFDQLVTFGMVAEYGSVSRTAEALHLSQSTVGGQLGGPQEQVGQPLFKRAGRGIVLTPAGEERQPYTHSVARSLRRATQHIQGVSERPTLVTKVCLSPILASWAARTMLEARRRGLPLRALPGHCAEMQQAVEPIRLDAAVVINPVSLSTERKPELCQGEL